MATPWFKLYGVEFLADPKIQRLTASERSCWVTLLCLASMDDGAIEHCEEDYLILHSGVDPLSPEWNKTHGILSKFEMLGMIQREHHGKIYIKNWQKRQQVYSESYERVKRWREKNGVTPVTLPSNVRVDKIRTDKNNKEGDVIPSKSTTKTSQLREEIGGIASRKKI